MNKSNSIELIDRTDSSEKTKFRFNEITKIENYFLYIYLLLFIIISLLF